jgi:cytochrome c-type biogenesis protein CcmH
MKKFLAVKLMKIFYLSFLTLFLFSNSHALSPETKLVDEAQEQRAMQLFLEVRCLVCNGQVIENSDTEFSFQMRKLIREKISKGESDEKIKSDLMKEFGEDILTQPQNFTKIFLWLMPAIFAIAGILFLPRLLRKS